MEIPKLEHDADGNALIPSGYRVLEIGELQKEDDLYAWKNNSISVLKCLETWDTVGFSCVGEPLDGYDYSIMLAIRKI
jgi:hypothetical protein